MDTQIDLSNIPGLEKCKPPELIGQKAVVSVPPPPVPGPKYGAVRRFDDRDVRSTAQWLLPKLHARYPHVNTRNFSSWAGSMASHNDHCFVRNDHAVGLACIGYEPCEPTPVCRVAWLYTTAPSTVHAGVAIFHHFLAWAGLMKCDRVVWENRLSGDAASLDVSNEHLKDVFPSCIGVYQRRVIRL